jgi:hypothetical protein
MLHPLLLLLAAAPSPATLTKSDTSVAFALNGQTVAEYRYAGTVELEKGGGTKPLAKPFFYPLKTPSGIGVTRDWPMNRTTPGQATDHYWQKSAWFCHGDVIPEGITLPKKKPNDHVKGVDFWAETDGHGRIVCTKCEIVDGKIVSTNRWQTADGTAIMTETRTVRMMPAANGYILDVRIALHASECKITFGDTKEGSFGVRVQDVFALKTAKSDGVITPNAGDALKAPAKDDLPLWGRAAEWHDYSGSVGGKPVGISIFDDPKNPHRAHWHTRAYGLMAANPFARAGSRFPGRKDDKELVKLNQGETLNLRYGLYVHDGGAAGVASAYTAFREN